VGLSAEDHSINSTGLSAEDHLSSSSPVGLSAEDQELLDELNMLFRYY
jgi:hypothetical protein